MSVNHEGSEPVKTTTPKRPRHQVRRSISETSPPVKRSLHHHLHHHHLHHHHSQRKDRAPLSAAPIPRGSLEMPRSEGVTPAPLADASQRLDMFLPKNDEAAGNARVAATLPVPTIPNDVRHQKRQQEEVGSATAGLRKSLVDLSTFSNTTMRRLDDTYYSVLERLSMLQNTIVAMKELAGMSQELGKTFESESQGMMSEVETQLSSFDQLDGQQKRITELQGRIYTGRERVQALSHRVDVVRQRIEGWERADRGWQERTRRRLKKLWMFTLVIALAMVLLFVGAQYAPSSMDVTMVTELGSGNTGGRALQDGMAENQSSSSAAAMAEEVREALSQRRGDSARENEVFRAFDEL
ncbi:hypothetical protein F4780DRAFT_770164 [Xylariomycetidae sp. FL0641]|nr:hypothetical protein F4780DRAFT_770164 [Xylariomycetidae sp. FL0641]